MYILVSLESRLESKAKPECWTEERKQFIQCRLMENKIKSFSGETCAHQNTEQSQKRSKILISLGAQNEFEKDVLASELYTTCTCHRTREKKRNFYNWSQNLFQFI